MISGPDLARPPMELHHLCHYLLVPFPARRVRTARLLWINERYFMEAGNDISDGPSRRQVEEWIIEKYGVLRPDPAIPESIFQGPDQQFGADRYGGSNGAHHGGSGRCGVAGSFNVKGIGRTPLVADNVDWGHSHGYMSLAEALKEAVSSEIAHAELPYGAVPVVAIIDTGISISRDKESAPERCALVVRPNFIRPAHFERSVYFGSSGRSGSDQHLDALRVRDAVATITGGDGHAFGFPGIRQMFLRQAAQIGAARALRLWQGRFLTSNMSVDGALADFGSFRAVANWRRSRGQVGENFGDEGGSISFALRSINHYFTKFAAPGYPIPAEKELVLDVKQEIDRRFMQTCFQALGLAPEDAHGRHADLAASIQQYYQAQQREQAKVDDAVDLRRPWVYDHLKRPGTALAPSCGDNPTAARLLSALQRALGDTGPSGLWTARRWLKPRPYLYYNFAARAARLTVGRLTGDLVHDMAIVARHIDKQVSQCRRHWPGLPAGIALRSQRVAGHLALLEGQDIRTGRMRPLLAISKGVVPTLRLSPGFAMDTGRPLADDGRIVYFELKSNNFSSSEFAHRYDQQ